MLRKLSFTTEQVDKDVLKDDLNALEENIKAMEVSIAQNSNASLESKAVFHLVKKSFEEAKKGNYETLRKLHQENKMIADLAFANKTTGEEYNQLISVIGKMNQSINDTTRPYINAAKTFSNFGIDKSINMAKNYLMSSLGDMPPIVQKMFWGGKGLLDQYKAYKENKESQKQELDAEFKDYLKQYGTDPNKDENEGVRPEDAPEKSILNEVAKKLELAKENGFELPEEKQAELLDSIKIGIAQEYQKFMQEGHTLEEVMSAVQDEERFNQLMLAEMKKISESPERMEEIAERVREQHPEATKEDFYAKEREEEYQRDSIEATNNLAEKVELLTVATQKNTEASSENGSGGPLSKLANLIPKGIKDAITKVTEAAPVKMVADGVKQAAQKVGQVAQKGGEAVVKGGKVAVESTKQGAKKGLEKGASMATKQGAKVIGKQLLKAVPVVGAGIMAYEAVSLVNDIVENDPMFSDADALNANVEKALEPQQRTDGLDLSSGLDDESMEHVELWQESTEQRQKDNKEGISFQKNLDLLKQMHKDGASRSWNILGGHFGDSREDIIEEMTAQWDKMDEDTRKKYIAMGIDPKRMYEWNGDQFKNEGQARSVYEQEGGTLAAMFGSNAPEAGTVEHAKLVADAAVAGKVTSIYGAGRDKRGARLKFEEERAMAQKAREQARQTAAEQKPTSNITNITNNNVVNNNNSKGGGLMGSLFNPSANAARGSAPVEVRW